jgi:hypothetical protein
MKMTRKYFWWIMVAWSFAAFVIQPACGQVREIWTARYPEEGGYAYAFAMALDPQGNPVVTGRAGSASVTIKYDKLSGVPRWVARYTVGVAHTQAIAIDHNGDIYVAGGTNQTATGYDFLTIKYEGETGHQLWASRYNGPPGNGSDSVKSLAIDLQGDVYVTGSSMGHGTGQDYATIKYDGQTGQQLWIARYNSVGSNNDYANAIVIDPADGVFVTGASGTIKYHKQTGQLLWGPKPGYGTAIAISEQGDIFVAGVEGSGYATYKFNGQTGQQLWGVISAPTGGAAHAIAIDSMGDVLITGGSDWQFTPCLTIKYSGLNGQALWTYSLPRDFFDLEVDEAGNVYVSGTARTAFPGPIGDFRTVKFDGRTGGILWRTTYLDAAARSVAVDKDGYVYVTGFEGPEFQTKYLTIKYEQAPPGDVNYDFCVNDIDLLRILLEFGQSGELPEDVNRDGVVDDKDLLTVLFNFGRGCGVLPDS